MTHRERRENNRQIQKEHRSQRRGQLHETRRGLGNQTSNPVAIITATSPPTQPTQISSVEPGTPQGVQKYSSERQKQIRDSSIAVLRGWLGKDKQSGAACSMNMVVKSYAELAKGEAKIRQNIESAPIEVSLQEVVTARRHLRDIMIASTRVAELAWWNERGVDPKDRVNDILPSFQVMGPFEQHLESSDHRMARDQEVQDYQARIHQLEEENKRFLSDHIG